GPGALADDDLEGRARYAELDGKTRELRLFLAASDEARDARHAPLGIGRARAALWRGDGVEANEKVGRALGEEGDRGAGGRGAIGRAAGQRDGLNAPVLEEEGRQALGPRGVRRPGRGDELRFGGEVGLRWRGDEKEREEEADPEEKRA